MTLRILIADDEAPARARLRRMVGESGAGEVVGETASGSETLAAVDALQPALVLLDIRMPEGDGLSVARALAEKEHRPAVIFVTALDDRTRTALEAGAAAYLVKPVARERLQAAIERARQPTAAQLDALSDEAAPRTHFAARVGRETRLVPLSDVYYFRAEDKTTLAVLVDGEVVLDSSLEALEEEFAPAFIRIRRNLLVARRTIRRFGREGSETWVELVDGTRLSVARRLKRRLAEVLDGNDA
jgi:two-component system response regulator AlgR